MSRQKEFDYDEKLITARDLFWKKGYNATSMNDLVDALKINRSSLYLTYGNKHDLFIKCLNSYNKLKGKEYREAAGSNEDPLTAVKNMVLAVLDVILNDDKTCLVVNSTFELARIDEEVKRILHRQTVWNLEIMEELLHKAKENGTLPIDKDPKAWAHFIMISITSIWYTQQLFSDPKLTRQMADILLETITK
ncbi:hypothetical protein ASE40_21030 [Flavobacterium sp. Root935]|uniref:TetR/AcrR family transcriptional regulator n=1 Tax=Flavobacterium sp. Root935 TaxID=1736610 RepID=UPI00070CE3FA|nr:TetR/AcrR family transcriptional regulator [Flavobacterium sp. Root935]KRD58792.1 hypothetical protein ASE40_21030 [Flavobacterium sp. Root935]